VKVLSIFLVALISGQTNAKDDHRELRSFGWEPLSLFVCGSVKKLF